VGVKPFAAAAVLAAPLLIGAQQQAPNAHGAWPCGARLDASYFQVADADALIADSIKRVPSQLRHSASV